MSFSEFSQHITDGKTALGGQLPVIKYGGSLLDSQERQEQIAAQLVFLQKAGVTPVIVHGGGKHITRALNAAGIESEFLDGLRITPESSIDILRDTLRTLNEELVAKVQRLGGKALSCPMEDLPAQVKPLQDGKYGRVGEIVKTHRSPLVDRLKQGIIFIPSLGRMDNLIYNVNADMVASAVAMSLPADCLLYLTDQDGVLDAQGNVIPVLTPNLLQELREKKIIHSGMLPKSRALLDALEGGIHSLRIINGRDENCILRALCTHPNIGTRFCKD